MLLRTLRWVASTTLLLLIFVRSASASPQQTIPPHPANGTEALCRPFGPCEPCPSDALTEPFCQPFGNRRLLHCSPAPSGDAPPPQPGEHGSEPTQRPHPANPLQGETAAWESCGRIVDQERADFLEFMACNVVFVGVAIFVVLARSKRLRALQARQLAARIGLGRGS
ncbi:hypothetical protein BV25DRAFT_1906410 [Artomyces pyxidatus]|uniref:Uncharacterized protein n=1 Tax=Artomyces pyxidatus TaxID=48021 RepID=A0ACB8T7W9_9AGAM|nr:hypothetical protein BV25DRAFT_1906410 [Artomyces pyxidatus]